MFEVTNLSNNPLPMSDGKSLAPGQSRKQKNISDKEAVYVSRNWLRVIEEKKEDAEKTGGTSK